MYGVLVWCTNFINIYQIENTSNITYTTRRTWRYLCDQRKAKSFKNANRLLANATWPIMYCPVESSSSVLIRNSFECCTADTRLCRAECLLLVLCVTDVATNSMIRTMLPFAVLRVCCCLRCPQLSSGVGVSGVPCALCAAMIARSLAASASATEYPICL